MIVVAASMLVFVIAEKCYGRIHFCVCDLLVALTKVNSCFVVLQLAWINDYHKKCRDVIGPELEKSGRQDALSWLLRETEPPV